MDAHLGFGLSEKLKKIIEFDSLRPSLMTNQRSSRYRSLQGGVVAERKRLSRCIQIAD
jgi:hypothetical protein